MSFIAPLIPDNAPFTPAPRAWINGWLAGYLATAAAATNVAPPVSSAAVAEEFPWHDAALPLDERLRLAEGQPRERRLMAAMAQLDCGQCGYLCRSYAEAIASGAESGLARCVPGGKATARALKELLEAPARGPATVPAVPASASAAPAAAPSRVALAGRFDGARRLNGDGSEKDTRHVVFRVDDNAF